VSVKRRVPVDLMSLFDALKRGEIGAACALG
jgi:hypothetical protein